MLEKSYADLEAIEQTLMHERWHLIQEHIYTSKHSVKSLQSRNFVLKTSFHDTTIDQYDEDSYQSIYNRLISFLKISEPRISNGPKDYADFILIQIEIMADIAGNVFSGKNIPTEGELYIIVKNVIERYTYLGKAYTKYINYLVAAEVLHDIDQTDGSLKKEVDSTPGLKLKICQAYSSDINLLNQCKDAIAQLTDSIFADVRNCILVFNSGLSFEEALLFLEIHHTSSWRNLPMFIKEYSKYNRA